MKNIKNMLLYMLSLALVGMACDTEDDLIDERKTDNPLPPDPGPLTGSPGSADFSTYVALGNSLTAGLMDATLYTRGQSNAFPNLLADRFALAGGGEFNQPDIDSENGFNTSLNDLSTAFTGPATFGRFVLDLSIRRPVPTTPGEVLNMVPANERGSINNLGLPGMRLLELPVNGYGLLNPFYTRFALDAGTTSVLEQALARQPSFITFWLGNNDALAWATGGGVGPDAADNPGVLDQDPGALVSTQSFEATLQNSLAAMFGSNPQLQGIILNIPNVALIPFFQLVQWNSIVMDEATATGTTNTYAGFNGFLNLIASPQGGGLISAAEAAYRQIRFDPVSITDDPTTEVVEGNAVVIEDDQMTDLTNIINGAFALGNITEEERDALLPLAKARQIKSVSGEPDLDLFGLTSELLTLSAGTVLGTRADPNNPFSMIGVGVPLGDQYTMTVDEIERVLTRIGAFNAIIEAQANAYAKLYLYDANALFTGIAASGGYTASNGFTYAPDFSPNGVFSTDGIHLNPAGHAILTNELMNLIEVAFEAELPEYDLSEFTTVLSTSN